VIFTFININIKDRTITKKTPQHKFQSVEGGHFKAGESRNMVGTLK